MKALIERFDLQYWETWAVLGIRIVVYGSFLYQIAYLTGYVHE